MKVVDLIGKRFGKLLVISRVYPNYLSGKTTRAKWLCECDCGKTVEVISHSLVQSIRGTKSCGCLRYEARTLPPGVAGRNKVLQEYKTGAAKRNLSWGISEEQFDLLTKGNCNYCGAEPNCKSRRRLTSKVVQFIYNGIDRVDNSRGYESDNVVSCCRICNKAKDVMSKEDFFSWIKKIVKHNGFFQSCS